MWKGIELNSTPTHDNSQQTRNTWELSQRDKEHLQKAYIIFNDEKLETFLLRPRTRQRCPLSPVLNIIMEILANAVMQEKEIKGIYIWKKAIKMSLFTGNTIIYT